MVDIASGAIRAHVKVGEEPEGVTVRPDGKTVYVTCEETNEVVAVDTATLKVVARMKASGRPRSVVFTPDSKTGFVRPTKTGGSISVINTARHTVASYHHPAEGRSRAAAAMGARSCRPDGTACTRLTRTVAGRCGDRCRDVRYYAHVRRYRRPGLGHHPEHGRHQAEYISRNRAVNDISIIDIATGKVDKKISTGGSPWGVVATVLSNGYCT